MILIATSRPKLNHLSDIKERATKIKADWYIPTKGGNIPIIHNKREKLEKAPTIMVFKELL